ncbi:hypothetical protein ASG33_23850 [Dyadobacter sp. Leaf189]|nr:hypothetical protein ASG33_23850 [Dyadobacter sp. Leaf189]
MVAFVAEAVMFWGVHNRMSPELMVGFVGIGGVMFTVMLFFVVPSLLLASTFIVAGALPGEAVAATLGELVCKGPLQPGGYVHQYTQVAAGSVAGAGTEIATVKKCNL